MIARLSNIIFRELGTHSSSALGHGTAWQVEYHDLGVPFPTGLVWVWVPADVTFLVEDSPDPREPAIVRSVPPAPAQIGYAHVIDQSRRRMIGARLLAACRQRWPGVRLSPPPGEAAEAFWSCMPAPQTEDVFTPDAIRSMRNQGATLDELDALARDQLNYPVQPPEYVAP